MFSKYYLMFGFFVLFHLMKTLLNSLMLLHFKLGL